MSDSNSKTERSEDFLQNKGRLTSIPVESIIADPIFQMRENGTDDVIVRRYAGVMENNDPDGWQIFPRITVLSITDKTDDRYCPENYADLTDKYARVYVVGGFHRLAAIQEVGYTDIEAIVIHGTIADGIVFAAGENDDKSVRRTLKDLRRAVLSCLQHPVIKEWVNPKIAEICAVDVQTVRNWETWLYKNDSDYSRPEKLKFRDKYGGVGLRKHSIPNFAVEVDSDDYEHKNANDFAVEKCDEAIRTYEEKQESLGLSDLPWYGEGGFFYYAQAEFEERGEKLGYASHTDTIIRLSEKAKLWESVTNAIKHKANWVKAVAGQEERKTERERQEAIKECRKLAKEAKRRFHEVREPLDFPDLEWENFILTYAQKQFEGPLFPHVLENAPLDKLKDRCGVWVAIKSALSAARPLVWVAEIAELHNKAKAEEQAQRKMIEAYENGQAAFEAHPLAKLIVFEYFMIEAGDYLDGDELEDPQFVHHSDAEAYKELWDGVAETLNQNEGWVKELLEKFSDEGTEEAEYHISHKEALSKAIDALNQAEQDYAACQSKLGLDELPWRSHIGPCFWNYAQDAFGVTGIEDGQLPILVEPSDSDSIERLIELRTLWNRVQLAIKLPGDWVKALKPDLDGLKEAMWKRINDLHGFVGGGTNLAKLYHTTPEKVIEVRDLILTESKQEERIDAPEEDTVLHNERALCAGHIAGAEHDFNQLKQKYKLQATFQDFYVYACEHFEEQRNLDLSRYIDGLRSIERIRELLEMWQGIVADIGAEADWIQGFVDRFKATEPEQPTALQIEPLGSVAVGDERSSINFKNLGWGTKDNIRSLARSSKSLLEEEDLPDYFKAILSNLLNTILDFAGSDELLKKILEESDADTG